MHSLIAELFPHCIVKFLLRAAHLLVRFLDVVEFLLLIGREQRTNLRHRFVHYRVRFLHRFLVDGDDLRFGLVDERLDFGLLIGREIQSVSQSFKREPSRAAVRFPKAFMAATAGLCLGQRKAAQRDRAGCGKCKQVSFHSFCLF